MSTTTYVLSNNKNNIIIFIHKNDSTLHRHVEPSHKKICLQGFRPGLTKQAVQPQKMVRCLKFRIYKEEEL